MDPDLDPTPRQGTLSGKTVALLLLQSVVFIAALAYCQAKHPEAYDKFTHSGSVVFGGVLLVALCVLLYMVTRGAISLVAGSGRRRRR